MIYSNYKNLSDNELIKLSRKKDQKAIDVLFARHYDHFAKEALKQARIIRYDFSLSNEELEEDSINEAFIAFNDAVQNFDFQSSSFKSYFSKKIRYHFLDLQRSNAKRSEHEVSYSNFEIEDAEDDYSANDYIERNAAKENFDSEERQKHLEDAIDFIRKNIKNAELLESLEALLDIYKNEDKKHVAKAAEKLEIKRQSVYNHLKAIRKELPEKFVNELLQIL